MKDWKSGVKHNFKKTEVSYVMNIAYKLKLHTYHFPPLTFKGI